MTSAWSSPSIARNWSISATTPSTFTTSEARFAAQLRNPQSDAVFLRCDETVPFGTFATVIDTLRQSGIENVSVVTEPLSARPKEQ